MATTGGGDDAQQRARRWRDLPYRWALRHAPVASSSERLVLSAYADHCDADGSSAYPGPSTLISITLLDETTIKRARRSLLARGLMVPGDQDRARRLPSGQRPRVLDLPVPYSWYAEQKGGVQALRDINAWRVEQGLQPLTPENRPALAPAPAKKQRADKGRPRKKAEAADPADGEQEEGATRPPFGEPDDTKEQEGGLQDPPRGGYETPQGVAGSPPTNAFNLASDPANYSLGDGRRPTPVSSGLGESGCAASGKTDPSLPKPGPSSFRTVLEGIPAPLARLLEKDWPRGLPAEVTDSIEKGLRGEQRTVQQLVDRMVRRWGLFGYEDAALATMGGGVKKPLGVLLEILSPSKCWMNNARCEDGVDIDTGVACPRCEEAREDRIHAAAPADEPAPARDRPTFTPRAAPALPLPPPRADIPDTQTYGVNLEIARQARQAVRENKRRVPR